MPGLTTQKIQSMGPSLAHLEKVLRRLLIAMTRHLFQTHSISQCVNLIVSMCYSSAHFAFLLVLHPQMKMAYFKAH